MNSLHKKIALACLVSLAANQTIQAFQFLDVWSWVKGNQKTTAAIVASITVIALIAAMKYGKKRSTVARPHQNTPPATAVPVFSQFVQFDDDAAFTYTTYAAGWTFHNPRNEPRLCPDAKDWGELTNEDKAELGSKEWQGRWIDWYVPMGKHVYVTVARDQQKKIAGAIFYETIGMDSPIRITHMYGETEALKTALRKPLIKTGKNIEIVETDKATHDLSLEIAKYDGGNLVSLNTLISSNNGFQKGVVFDRSERRLLESGRAQPERAERKLA